MRPTDHVFDQLIGKMEVSLNMVQELESMLTELSDRAHKSHDREHLVAPPGGPGNRSIPRSQ